MDHHRQTLKRHTKDELIDIIVDLEAEIERLKEERASSQKPVKTSKNSSQPPSQSRQANIPQKPKAKRGPKVGHAGTSRRRTEPDMIVPSPVEACTTCGCDLRHETQRMVGQSQVVEIPPMQPVVIEAQRYTATCPQCGQQATAVYPVGFEPQRVFGPNLETLIHYLHWTHPLSYQRVQTMVRNLTGLSISIGALVNAVHRARARLEQAALELRDQVRASIVVGSDETGARVAGRTWWQWVFQTAQVVYFTMHPRRNAAVLKQVLGPAQPLTWVSDLGSAQLKHPACELPVCLAHQVRDLQAQIDHNRCRWAYDFQAMLYQAIRLGRQRDCMPPAWYGDQVQRLEAHCDALLDVIPPHPNSQRLRRRFLKHRQSLFVFLYRHNVPPTNNASEQALRNSVIYRKVTGGSF